MSISINVINSNFDHDSKVIENFYEDMSSEQINAILNELQRIRKSLEPTQALSQSIKELELTIQKRDKSKLKKIIQQLTTGTASSLLANMASKELQKFLGIL